MRIQPTVVTIVKPSQDPWPHLKAMHACRCSHARWSHTYVIVVQCTQNRSHNHCSHVNNNQCLASKLVSSVVRLFTSCAKHVNYTGRTTTLNAWAKPLYYSLISCRGCLWANTFIFELKYLYSKFCNNLVLWLHLHTMWIKYWPFFHNLAEKDHPASAQLKYQCSFRVNVVVLAWALTVCSALENLLQDSTYQIIMHVINWYERCHHVQCIGSM